MRTFPRRTTLALAATMALALSTAPNTAVAAPAAEARLVGTQVFRFTFDNGESLKPGTRVRDASGHGNYGIVTVSGRGRLTVEQGLKGRGAGYPGGCRKCGRALIEVADGKGMDARRRPFSFGAAVKLKDRQAKRGKDPNILQKGLTTQRGGQWKLALVGAKPKCVFTGARGSVAIESKQPVDDNKWHRLQCRRIGRTVTLRVDGAVVASANAATGSIRNNAPIRVGGKAVGPAADNDQYHGDLDNVFYSIERKS